MPKPLNLRDPRRTVSIPLTKLVCDYLDEVIYAPLRLKGFEVRENEKYEHLVQALVDGQVQYHDGVFSGKYNSLISSQLRQIGAWLHPMTKTWRVDTSKLPMEIRSALAMAGEKSADRFKLLLTTLGQIKENLPYTKSGITFKKSGDEVVLFLLDSFGEAYGEKQYLTQKDKYLDEFEDDCEDDLQDLAIYQLERLEERIKELQNAERVDKIDKSIDISYASSRKQAAVFVENRVSEFATLVVEKQSKALGINRYVWATCEDDRVRESHERLHNRIFDWSDPPITDQATGYRCHPGEAPNCRCWALPIIPHHIVR